MTSYSGGCLCGSLRYSATGSPVNERICHCRICQKAIGASFNARLLFEGGDVAMTGPVTMYHSSDDLERLFCPTCGTTVSSRRASNGRMGITAATLDDPSLFRPTLHFWTESRQPWLRFDDGLAECQDGAP